MQSAPLGPTSRIHSAIAAASARSGVDFRFLLREAEIESGLRPDAQAGTSSARGLFQFTEGTWLDTVRRHGADAGLGWAADALKVGQGGPLRQIILALRDNPEVAASLAASHAADNADILSAATGRVAGAVELYLAHFLGPGGAVRFLRGMAADASQSGAALFPAAAASNPGIFGGAASLAAIYERFAVKFGGNGAVAASALAIPASGNAARLAYLTLAALGR